MKQTIKLLKEMGAQRRALAWELVRRRVIRRIVARETATPTWRRGS